MLEMLMVANSAFAVIKQTIENGRDISSAGAAIGKFVGAEDQLQQDLNKERIVYGLTFLVRQTMTLKSSWHWNRYELRKINSVSSCNYMVEPTFTMTTYNTVLMLEKLGKKLG